MHNAPSVSYPVGRCAFQRRLVVLQTLWGGALMLAWAVMQPMGWIWALTTATLAAVAYSQWRAQAQAPLVLCWAHGRWWIQDESSSQTVSAPLHCVAAVKPVFDGQSVLLLRCASSFGRLGSGVRWLWLDQTAKPTHWLDLRRAVYSSLR